MEAKVDLDAHATTGPGDPSLLIEVPTHLAYKRLRLDDGRHLLIDTGLFSDKDGIRRGTCRVKTRKPRGSSNSIWKSWEFASPGLWCMGKGRDKRKKAKGSQSGQGDVKTAKKTDKNLEKASRRAEKRAEVYTYIDVSIV